MGQKQSWGHIPKVQDLEQPRAVEHAVPPRLSRLCPCAAAGPAGPCGASPAAAAVFASLCRQRDTRRSPLPLLAVGAPGFALPQPRGSTVPCQPDPLPASSPSPSFG